MPDFAAFFASGQVAELMVAVLFVEALALLGFWWLTGRGLPPQSVIALVLPGVFVELPVPPFVVAEWRSLPSAAG